MENEQSINSGSGLDKTINPESKSGKDADKPAKGFLRKNPVLFTALIGILAIAVVYFWKDIQGKKQKAEVEKMASAQIMENTREMLKLVTKPFVWSIRAEMLRENMDQVNIYTKEMIREKNFQIIYLIDPEGKIVISTDKKLEGQLAAGMVETGLLQTDSVMVLKKDDLLTVAAPVMGYDKKLGVLIMSYLPEKFSTEKISTTDTLVVTK